MMKVVFPWAALTGVISCALALLVVSCGQPAMSAEHAFSFKPENLAETIRLTQVLLGFALAMLLGDGARLSVAA